VPHSSFPFPQTGTPEGASGFIICNEAQQALYALLSGAEGCGSAARSARLAQDDELADFLCRAQDDIVGEAKRLLAQRVAE
jgi:hypothetical protein